jgi:hypothetical protein
MFVAGALLGFAGVIGAVAVLGWWHMGRVPWRVPLKEHPLRSEYRRMRQELDRFLEEARHRQIELPPEYRKEQDG